MGILDWSFVILLSSGLLFFLFTVVFLVLFLWTNRTYKQMKKKQAPKNKKKRRKFLRLRKQLMKKRKGQGLKTLLFLILTIIALGSGVYSRNYQQNHLQGEDSGALVQSYYLLEDAVIQINNVNTGENPQKSMKNIKEISSRLASYGARKSALTLKEDGQLLLNRHYTALRELGVNLNAQSIETLENNETVETYLKDIKKVQESQKKVFKRFNVNEAALKQRKK